MRTVPGLVRFAHSYNVRVPRFSPAIARTGQPSALLRSAPGLTRSASFAPATRVQLRFAQLAPPVVTFYGECCPALSVRLVGLGAVTRGTSQRRAPAALPPSVCILSRCAFGVLAKFRSPTAGQFNPGDRVNCPAPKQRKLQSVREFLSRQNA